MKYKIVYKNVVLMIILHIFAILGFYTSLFSKFQTILFFNILALLSSIGITAGAHRLWCHKGYHAKLPISIILMIFNTMAIQDSIYHWSRDHRLHHKYSDTDADPYNSSNGFFFSHMGWLMVKKNEHVIEKGKTINMNDLENDKIVMFQKKYYVHLVLIFKYFLLFILAKIILNEKYLNMFFLNLTFHVITLHHTWTVNSLAHLYGKKPYDTNIIPKDNNFVSYLSLGEGYHNYYHTYPMDYTGNLYGPLINFNLTTIFVNICIMLDLVSNTKTLQQDIKRKLIKKNQKTYSANYLKLINSQILGIVNCFWPTIIPTILKKFIIS